MAHLSVSALKPTSTDIIFCSSPPAPQSKPTLSCFSAFNGRRNFENIFLSGARNRLSVYTRNVVADFSCQTVSRPETVRWQRRRGFVACSTSGRDKNGREFWARDNSRGSRPDIDPATDSYNYDSSDSDTEGPSGTGTNHRNGSWNSDASSPRKRKRQFGDEAAESMGAPSSSWTPPPFSAWIPPSKRRRSVFTKLACFVGAILLALALFFGRGKWGSIVEKQVLPQAAALVSEQIGRELNLGSVRGISPLGLKLGPVSLGPEAEEFSCGEVAEVEIKVS